MTKELLEAREKLKANNLEAGLPGREEQYERIHSFLVERLRVKTNNKARTTTIQTTSHLNQTIFICGVPGTGKTATVMAAIEGLKKVTPKLSYSLVEINGMQLTAPDRVYSEFLYQMTGVKMGPERAQDKLTSIFTSDHSDQTRKHTILVIDELDVLYTDRRQSIFYNLFDWPTSAQSKLIVIAIANAMDLPERFMSAKVMSRIGWEKVIFESYTSDGLDKILLTRLGKKLMTKCFERMAIVLATKKVGRTSGDARRILDLCRMAIDLAIDQKIPKVTTRLIDQATNQNFDQHRRSALLRCSNIQKLILRCVLKESDRLGEDNVKIIGVHTQFMLMLPHYTFIKRPKIEKFYADVVDMASQSLIFIDQDKPFLEKRIFIKSLTDSFKDLILQFTIEQPKPIVYT